MNRVMYVCAIILMLSAQYAFSADLSSQVKFTPEKNPMVALNGMEYVWGNEIIKIKGPWYTFNYSITNTSPHRLYVRTFHFDTKGQRITLDPNQFCAPGMRRDYVAIVESGETFTGLAHDYSGGLFSRCDYSLPLRPGQYEGWYVQDLPENKNSYIYDIKVSAEGFFEDTTTGNFVESFEASGRQHTR